MLYGSKIIPQSRILLFSVFQRNRCYLQIRMDNSSHFSIFIPWIINFLHYFIDFNSTGREFFSYGKRWHVLITARKKCPRKTEVGPLRKEVKSAARQSVCYGGQEAKHTLELFVSILPTSAETEVETEGTHFSVC